MSLEQALRAYTIDGAYAQFQERVVGSLERGKLADFVVLSQDLFEIPQEKIGGVEAYLTVVSGKIIYRQEPAH